MKAFIFIIFSLIQFAHSVEITPEDVSILFPLPHNQEQRKSYLSANQVLVPEIYQYLNQDLGGLYPILFDESSIDSLAVMAIRLDPDFRDVHDDPGVPQIRLTLQPLQLFGKSYLAQDAAIHLFYRFRDLQAFIDLMRKLLSLKNSGVSNKRLDVHSRMHELSFQSQFQQEILRAIQSSILTRVAIMSADPANVEWFFKAYDVRPNGAGTRLAERQIHGVSERLQTLQVLQAEQPDPYNPTEFLSIKRNTSSRRFNEIMDYIKDSVSYKRSDSKLISLKKTVDELLQASVFLPGESDCISCHVAPAIKDSFVLNRDERNFGITDFIHFGYIRSEKKISQRVEQETLTIVKKVQELMK